MELQVLAFRTGLPNLKWSDAITGTIPTRKVVRCNYTAWYLSAEKIPKSDVVERNYRYLVYT